MSIELKMLICYAKMLEELILEHNILLPMDGRTKYSQLNLHMQCHNDPQIPA